MLDIGSERQRREKVQRADQQDRAEQQNEKGAAETGNVPALGGEIFFCTSEPARAMIGTIIRKRPINMAIPSVVLYQGVFAGKPGEGAAVVSRWRS